MKHLTPLCLITLTLLVSACAPSSTLDLKFKLPEKSTFNYTYSMEQDITSSTMGMDQEQRQMEAMEYEYKVLKTLDDDSKDIMVTIVAVEAQQDGPTGGMSYNSKSDEEAVDQMSRIYEKMVGQEFRMLMDNKGKVTKVTGADEMLDDMISVAGLPEGDAMVDNLKTSLKRQFGNVAMAEHMSMLTVFYPDKPVKVGEKWNKTVTRTAGIGMIIKTTYILISRGKGKAYIDFSSKIEPLPGAPPLELGVMSIQYKLGGQQTGSMVVDESSGWSEQAEIHQLISGDMKIMSPELPFGAIDGTMKAKSIIRMEKLD